jgi:hypothetical protein
MRLDPTDIALDGGREVRRPVILSNDSENDSLVVGMGGKSCGGAVIVEEPATSSG